MAEEGSGDPGLLFGAGSSGKSLSVLGEYDPGFTEEIDRKIRNMPFVVEYIFKKANELRDSTGSSNFEIVLSTSKGGRATRSRRDFSGRKYHEHRNLSSGASEHGTEKSRPRAYVVPSNNMGIHEELSQAVLLKAAMGMSGK